MEDGDGEDLTRPFWVQSTSNALCRRHVTTALVSLLLLVTALLFLVFIVPTSIKPNSVKRGWDSLNIALVLVAVVFGFLSRNKNYDDFQASPSKQNGSTPNRWYKYSYDDTIEGPKSNLPNSSQWYEYSDYQAKLERKNSILTRNSSSYPDLRETSTTTHWSYGDYYSQRRYYDDDIRVDSGRIRNTGQGQGQGQDQGKTHRRHRSLEGVENLRAPLQNKTVIVETLISESKGGANLPPPRIEEKSSHRSSTKLNNDFDAPMGRKKERSNRTRIKDMESKDLVSMQRKIGGSSTKDFLNSLYNKKKRKQRQKSVDDSDSPLSFQVPPPPAPPPPFQTLFASKKHNRKRTITVTLEPQTPFPPAPTPREPESTTLHAGPPPTQNPPKPIKMATFDKLEEIGGESPLNRIPPPPPPPPLAAFYKRPAWKFVVQGDYVRVNSITDTDEGESDVTPSSVGAGAAASYFYPSPPLFCASPDVDTKAESFITNFRAKLKLDKIHSMNRRGVGLSGLGPGPGPTQFTLRK